eukprot:Mrub_10614.p1 GENE.Mrub_10614~~Mrub_10614.p1  ORF type:complete len:200 (-),score=55.81 Mrub_10614:69-617(-)
MKKQEERDAKKAKAEMDKSKKQLAEAIRKGDSVQIDHCSKKTLLEKKNYEKHTSLSLRLDMLYSKINAIEKQKQLTNNMKNINKHLSSIKDDVDLKKMIETDETFKELCEDFDIAEATTQEVFGNQMDNMIDDEERQNLINNVCDEFNLDSKLATNAAVNKQQDIDMVSDDDITARLNKLKG